MTQAFIKKAYDVLEQAEGQLVDVYIDAMDAAEEEAAKDPHTRWDYTVDGQGRLFAENACPEIDTALHRLREAMMVLAVELKEQTNDS